MFNLKGEFAKVAAALETAWTELKNGANDVANFIETQGATVTKDTAEIGEVITAALPGAAGAVSIVESVESKVMGIVLAGSQEIANATGGNAPQTIAALKLLLPQLGAAAAQLAGKPVVVAANS